MNNLKDIPTEQLLKYLANAFATYQQCFGHTKASHNKMAVDRYRKELKRRKYQDMLIPTDKEFR